MCEQSKDVEEFMEGEKECFSSAVVDVIINTVSDVAADKFPIVGTLKQLYEKSKENYTNFHNEFLFKKIKCLLDNINSVSPENRQWLINAISEAMENDSAGDILISHIDKYETTKKIKIFAKMFVDTCNKKNGMTTEIFLRLSKIMESIPYSDFCRLEDYKNTEKEADIDGATELLFASGALKLSGIPGENSGNENKYKLSPMGIRLLAYYKNNFSDIEQQIDFSKGGTTASTITWNDDFQPISEEELKKICK